MLYMQEEIAHCASGVRWLTYLHRQACSALCTRDSLGLAAQLQNTASTHSLPADQPNAGSASLHSTCSPNLEPVREHVCSSTTLTALGATAASIHEPLQDLCASEESSDGQRQSAAPECAAESHSKEATSHRASLHDWQADAQQFNTVEDWFHALVRAHFKGSLKVRSMDYSMCSWLAGSSAQLHKIDCSLHRLLHQFPVLHVA